MPLINKYTTFIPYLYFISISAYWFTIINRTEGHTAYPILLFGIPFLWQIIKPNKKLNLILGMTFVCMSSYLILAFISVSLNIISLSYPIKQLFIYGGAFVFVSFIMALWIVRNSLKKRI